MSGLLAALAPVIKLVLGSIIQLLWDNRHDKLQMATVDPELKRRFLERVRKARAKGELPPAGHVSRNNKG